LAPWKLFSTSDDRSLFSSSEHTNKEDLESDRVKLNVLGNFLLKNDLNLDDRRCFFAVFFIRFTDVEEGLGGGMAAARMRCCAKYGGGRTVKGLFGTKAVM
jgi:hypothetical protein